MIILYIPFIHVGDLQAKAELWKSRSSKPEAVKIIKHDEDIDCDALEGQDLCIYVLSHGIDDKENHAFDLANNSRRDDNLKIISIREIAHRFNRDFTCLHSDIKKVKLYFCNNKGNEEEIARQFVKELVLLDEVKISCYKGTLFVPNTDGNKKARVQGKDVPEHEAERAAYLCTSPIKRESHLSRSPIKKSSSSMRSLIEESRRVNAREQRNLKQKQQRYQLLKSSRTATISRQHIETLLSLT